MDNYEDIKVTILYRAECPICKMTFIYEEEGKAVRAAKRCFDKGLPLLDDFTSKVGDNVYVMGFPNFRPRTSDVLFLIVEIYFECITHERCYKCVSSGNPRSSVYSLVKAKDTYVVLYEN